MPIEILMPALSPTMEEGTLTKWLVKEGDIVSSGDLLAEIETDKATMEFEAVDEGVISKIMIAEGTEGVKVNAVIAVLLEDGESAGDISASAATPAAAPAAPAAKDGNRVFASPLARRIAADKGIDLKTMSGSGPRGRIVKADVEGASAAPAAVSAAAPTAAAMPASASAEAVAKMYADREYTEISLNGMRKTIAARLTEAKQTVPHFYLRRDINLDALLSFRGELNKQLAARDVKLSINDFIIKACALALQSVPDANAVWAGDRVFNLKPSDVAVAVAIEGGLFTPVLKDAEVKSLSALSAEMKDLATRAKDRKLAPHEYHT